VEIVEAGVLDNLTADEIATLAPAAGDYVLVTRLRDGTQVSLSRESIFHRLQALVDRLAGQSDLVLILCGAEFPGLSCSRLLLEPCRILQHVVSGVAQGRRLGVVVPLPAQVEEAQRRWRRVTDWVATEVATPYQIADFGGIGKTLRARGSEVIVIDGMAYTTAHKRLVLAASEIPTVLPITVVARVLKEFIVSL
jgi:protein AroM